MKLDEYQRAAYATARIHWDDPLGHHVPALGAIGELGSLVAEFKKSLRDGPAYTEARTNLIEEFGDLLWYLGALASHHNLTLSQLECEPLNSKVDRAEFGHIYAMIRAFSSLVIILQETGPTTTAGNKRKIAKSLASAVNATIAAVRIENLDLKKVLAKNLRKVRGMFGLELPRPARCFDAGFPEYERLPRKIDVQFLERARSDDRVEVVVRASDFNFGDRLTDNARKGDGYRFHDAFHLAYVAVLGWSPVIRNTFRCKRKSDRKIDEVQDGARAAIIEEAISQTIFNYARGHSMLKGLERIDYGLLKLIQRMARGLEVEICTLFEWQRAIIVGFEAFRSLQKNHGGWLSLDAKTQSLTYSNKEPGAD